LVRAFNPGLTADGSGGWLLAYRLVGQDAKRRIGICRLDAKGAVITGSAQPLSDSFRLRPGCLYPAEAYTWFADPRLFRLGAACSFTGTPAGTNPATISSCRKSIPPR
jgi:hypothetical protein